MLGQVDGWIVYRLMNDSITVLYTWSQRAKEVPTLHPQSSAKYMQGCHKIFTELKSTTSIVCPQLLLVGFLSQAGDSSLLPKFIYSPYRLFLLLFIEHSSIFSTCCCGDFMFFKAYVDKSSSILPPWTNLGFPFALRCVFMSLNLQKILPLPSFPSQGITKSLTL